MIAIPLNTFHAFIFSAGSKMSVVTSVVQRSSISLYVPDSLMSAFPGWTLGAAQLVSGHDGLDVFEEN